VVSNTCSTYWIQWWLWPVEEPDRELILTSSPRWKEEKDSLLWETLYLIKVTQLKDSLQPYSWTRSGLWTRTVESWDCVLVPPPWLPYHLCLIGLSSTQHTLSVQPSYPPPRLVCPALSHTQSDLPCMSGLSYHCQCSCIDTLYLIIYQCMNTVTWGELRRK